MSPERSVPEEVMRETYSASRGTPLGALVYPGETRGDVMRRRREVRQPITDAGRAERRARTRVGWTNAAQALGA